MSAIRKLASETAIYGIPTIVGRLLNVLLVPLYTKLFLPEEYGIVSYLFAFASFFNVVLTYGMETTYFRFSAEHPENDKVYSTAYNSVIITSLLFLFVTFIYTQPIADWMEIGNHPEYLTWFAVIAFFDALVAIPLVKLRQLGKVKRFALVRSINIGANIGINMFFLVLCPYLIDHGHTWAGAIYNKEFGIGYIFIANLVASIITWPLVYPENLQFNFGFDAELWRKMIPYAMPLLVVGLAGMVNETLDRILLAKLLPQDVAKFETGVYSACYKLSIPVTLFIQAYRMGAEPFLFARSKDKNAGFMYARLMNYFVMVCGVIFLLVTFFLQLFADVFLRDSRYHQGLFVVPILLLANIFLGIYYNLSIWYKLANKNIIGSYIAIVAALLTIGLNFLLIPQMKHGYEGSAWATLIAYFFMAVASYIAGKKHYPIPYQLNKIYAFLLAMVLFYLVYVGIEKTAGSVNIFVKILMLFAYAALVLGIERFNLLGRLKAKS